MSLIEKSRQLMLERSQINKAPSVALIEIAVTKGRELALKYSVSEELVVVSLYLAHTVFNDIWGSEIQNNHPELSADFCEQYLNDWGVEITDKEEILNSIKLHHTTESPNDNILSQVVRNAEGFKFISKKGALIWLHELGLRGFSYNESVDKVLRKMEQKFALMTLEDCIIEAKNNRETIHEIFT